MLPDLDKAAWQQRFDDWFPEGATVSWERGDSVFLSPTSQIIRVPRVMVWKANPEGVRIVINGGMSIDGYIAEWLIVDYEEVEHENLTVRALTRDDGVTAFFNNHMPEGLKAQASMLRNEIWFLDSYMEDVE